jgi:hypothetical protein
MPLKIAGTLRSDLLKRAASQAASVVAADSIWPALQNKLRLHACAEFALTLDGSPDPDHQRWLPAVLACIHKLAAMCPGDVTADVERAQAIGPGVAAWDVDGLPAYFSYMPRDDAPGAYDEQTAFAADSANGVVFCLGGNGSGTTTCVLAKAVRFMLENPPVRKNCPFWVIAGSYEQTMSLYDEKLDQKGHLPAYCVQQDKIKWYNSNSNWPYRVPLKPDEHGNNWVLEFKSYEQGRRQMQARSVGGFAFIEQFPWELLTEVTRGCREANMRHYRGNKLAEFTPIDPAMSANLEEMIRFGKAPADKSLRIRGASYMPDNWSVHYCNTAIAAELGHVDPEWFDEFMAMVPEDMQDVRIRGMFASYEGLIYKELNPGQHYVDDSVWAQIPDDAVNIRAIDWGAGQDNFFVCLWGLRGRDGRWYIFDEYYSNDQSRTTVEHLVEVYRRHPWKSDNKHGRSFADPSSPDGFRIASKLRQYTNPEDNVEPIVLSGAYNRVLEGIEHVKYLLKASLLIDGPDGDRIAVPRLHIHEANCPNLCRELRSYRWKKSTGLGINPQDAKPEPLKKDDHACDALRYMTISADRSLGETIDVASNHGEAQELVRRASGAGWRKTLARR